MMSHVISRLLAYSTRNAWYCTHDTCEGKDCVLNTANDGGSMTARKFATLRYSSASSDDSFELVLPDFEHLTRSG